MGASPQSPHYRLARGWDAGGGGGGGGDPMLEALYAQAGRPDDVQFLQSIIATIAATFAEVATHRVYLTGRGAGCSHGASRG